MQSFVNLGCGQRIAEGWTNIDFHSAIPAVQSHDLTQGVPLSDQSCDFIYHSHLLEHLSRDQGRRLLQECLRVLRPDGIVRVVVPDLQFLARRYLSALERIADSAPASAASYDWAVIHLLDQMVRHRSGGEMLRYLTRPDISNLDEVISLWGTEALAISRDPHNAPGNTTNSGAPSRLSRLFHVLRGPKRGDALRIWLARMLMGRRAAEAMQTGLFRMSGEAHLWMYDAHSLTELLELVGFVGIKQFTATTSNMNSWPANNLDTDVDGKIYRPDSIYLEARKKVKL